MYGSCGFKCKAKKEGLKSFTIIFLVTGKSVIKVKINYVLPNYAKPSHIYLLSLFLYMYVYIHTVRLRNGALRAQRVFCLRFFRKRNDVGS